MKKIMDIYFRNPVKVDFILSFLLIGILYFLAKKSILLVPDYQTISTNASETITIALTLSGFILTLLTVLITFKSGVKEVNDHNQAGSNLLDIFCNSPYFGVTTSILKNCVKALVFTSIIIYSCRLFVNNFNYLFLYLTSIMGIIIVVLTILRSLYILNKILEFQK